MAGSDPTGFSASAVRTALRSAMVMGAPGKTSAQVTFKWTTARTFDTADPAGLPYDWTETAAATTTHPDVQIPVAVQFRSSAPQGTAFGELDLGQIELTILDEDYEDVRGADRLTIDGKTYVVEFVAPPVGLFSITVYTVYARAQDLTTESL